MSTPPRGHQVGRLGCVWHRLAARSPIPPQEQPVADKRARRAVQVGVHAAQLRASMATAAPVGGGVGRRLASWLRGGAPAAPLSDPHSRLGGGAARSKSIPVLALAALGGARLTPLACAGLATHSETRPMKSLTPRATPAPRAAVVFGDIGASRSARSRRERSANAAAAAARSLAHMRFCTLHVPTRLSPPHMRVSSLAALRYDPSRCCHLQARYVHARRRALLTVTRLMSSLHKCHAAVSSVHLPRRVPRPIRQRDGAYA